MSKIICDICGTVYPDNANACPICGYPRKDSEKASEEPSVVVDSGVNAAVSASSRSKGGRFSNKNVKKRNKAESSGQSRRERRQEPAAHEPEEKGGNRGLVIAVAILAIAVVIVGGYILFRFFNGRDAYDNPNAPVIGTNPAETGTQTQPTETEPAPTGVPCVGMTVSDSSVEFLGSGRGWRLTVGLTPEDTTDELTFTSSDESVVTVTADGRLTSVGPGTATITITCGAVTRECQVYCTFGEDSTPTEPDETTDPDSTTGPTLGENETEMDDLDNPGNASSSGFELDRSDVTLFAAGETFTFGITYDGETVSPASVEWKSEDPAIATVENGKVTAVAKGKTTIIATYKGETRKCVVRCRFDDEQAATEGTEPTEKTYADTNWKMSSAVGDVTLIIGESFTLTLTNDAGEIADVTWSSSNPGVVAIDGNVITGKLVGYTEVTATVSGQTFTCIVRVIQNR